MYGRVRVWTKPPEGWAALNLDGELNQRYVTEAFDGTQWEGEAERGLFSPDLSWCALVKEGGRELVALGVGGENATKVSPCETLETPCPSTLGDPY